MPVFDFSTGMLTPEDAQVIIEASKGKPLLDRSESAWQTHNAHYFLDTLANRVVTGMRTGDNWMAPTGMILVVNALDVALRIKESFDDRCRHGRRPGVPWIIPRHSTRRRGSICPGRRRLISG